MHEPDDYSLTPAQTLAQVTETRPPAGFVQFWSRWWEEVESRTPALEPCSVSDASHSGAPDPTHWIRSTGGVRIGCRLVMPRSGTARGVVVTTHGYQTEPGEPFGDDNRWDRMGLALLKVRIRGYPGSQFDTGDLTSEPLGIITRGLGEGQAWFGFQAVADLVNAVRSAEQALGPSAPVYLHGESFGGGLALIAASVLPYRRTVRRLAIGLPSFGWWNWRLEHRCPHGMGGQVLRWLDAHSARRESILESLALADAVVHAHRVTAPTVCKIALRDEVVPSPTAAAVYNALGVDPDLKWRFVTKYGHFDGGLADLRRHAAFERLTVDFFDPDQTTRQAMHRWEPSLYEGDAPPEGVGAGESTRLSR